MTPGTIWAACVLGFLALVYLPQPVVAVAVVVVVAVWAYRVGRRAQRRAVARFVR